MSESQEMRDMVNRAMSSVNHIALMEAANKRLVEAFRRSNLVAPQVESLAEKYPGILPNEGGAGLRSDNTPPPPRFTCPVCDWWTVDHWRMKVHVAINPETCQRMATRKRRAWSQDVGIDV